jgi:hypothetical protein
MLRPSSPCRSVAEPLSLPLCRPDSQYTATLRIRSCLCGQKWCAGRSAASAVRTGSLISMRYCDRALGLDISHDAACHTCVSYVFATLPEPAPSGALTLQCNARIRLVSRTRYRAAGRAGSSVHHVDYILSLYACLRLVAGQADHGVRHIAYDTHATLTERFAAGVAVAETANGLITVVATPLPQITSAGRTARVSCVLQMAVLACQ